MTLWQSILEFHRLLLVLVTAAIGVVVVSALYSDAGVEGAGGVAGATTGAKANARE